jgi:transcriptional regulator with XRE-family HTH domain
MPKKHLPTAATPTLIEERLRSWGLCIRHQRLTQKIRAADLCQRIAISPATLRRLENGDSGAGSGIYLTALMVLGVLEQVAPALDTALWHVATGSRVGRTKADSHDDDF